VVNPGTRASPHPEERSGLVFGFAAYALWGLFPLYFHLLQPTSAIEILCHRVLWTLVTMAVFLAVRRERGWPRAVFRDRRTALTLATAAVLIALNWLIYVWAVGVDRVVEAALGYFICPLFTVVLGVVVLRERLRRLQWAAAALGAVAVGVLSAAYGQVPWIALSLAVSFSLYGFIKKRIELPASQSLAGETLTLAPAALATMVVLAATGRAELGNGGIRISLLLAGSGVVTAIPLALFAASAQRIPLILLGLLQYITPTLQFVLGLVVFDEAMSVDQWVGFSLVWGALLLLSLDAIRSARTGRGGDDLLSPATAELG
jgi:chloramphenicol-sensitive protein RarD